MRIVIDTNVFISSFISHGSSHRVLEHCLCHHQVVTSRFILDEFREKLVRKFGHLPHVADQAINLLRSRMEVIDPGSLSQPVCRDPDDDNILAAAFFGQCDCIVTGDKDLLALGKFGDIEIMNPATFALSEGISM